MRERRQAGGKGGRKIGSEGKLKEEANERVGKEKEMGR